MRPILILRRLRLSISRPASFCLALALALSYSASPTAVSAAEQKPCVRVYYDRSSDPTYWMGETYANLLQNLLGHFPEFQQIVSPIELYEKGDLETCRASLYIGSYFDNSIPAAFFEDFETTKRNVAWLGYNVWKLSESAMVKTLGHTYGGLTTLDTKNRLPTGEPTFFKDVLYKGETFFKYGRFSRGSTSEFVAPFEMTILKPSASNSAQVLATARHNGTGEVLPYAIRKGNRFYVADVPFSFMHEADRYLIFSDLLFDILDAKPRRSEHYAFLRLEDIHPLVPISYLTSATRALEREGVPVNVSLIPIFFDPLEQYSRENNQEFVTLTQVPEFMSVLNDLRSKGATMIWHGTTHQLDRIENPHSGVSGDDFEFWDAINGRILPQDSARFVLDRLDAGYYDLAKADLAPIFWLTPHYQASPLDYMIFGRVFPWNIGRVIYFNHRVKSRPSPLSDEKLQYSRANDSDQARAKRLAHFDQLQVEIESDRWSGQMFPYEIYGDIYGQRLLPENLGNSQPTVNAHVVQPRSVQEMIADAKRNLVLRDSWGSFFYHVQLLNTDSNGGRGRFPGDSSELVFLVRELKKLGYKFIKLDDFAKTNTLPIRPEPIYLRSKNYPSTEVK